jgi:16S rRNA processing protein RimM
MGETVVVGRIGKAHGIRGDVTVEPRTDVPERRFTPGAQLHRDGGPPLVVADSRWHSGRLLVHFDGTDDRGAAETLRGTLLRIDVDDAGPAAEPDDDGEMWWDRDLIGLTAVTVDGAVLGRVADVVHTPAGELLAIGRAGGGEHLIPFVRDIVPTVDLTAGRLVVDPPPGLLDLADPGASGRAG